MGFEKSTGDHGGVKPFGTPVKDTSTPADTNSGDRGGVKPFGTPVKDNTKPHNFG
jgi:hypothetical protein